MVVESLSLKTDLIFWRHHGSVIDRGDYLVVQTPRNPGWRWGHVIAFKNAPTPEALGTWTEAFEREFSDTPQPAPLFTWDKGELANEEIAALTGCGVRQFDVMVLSELREPRLHNIDVRPVETNAEWEQLARNSVQTFGRGEEAYREWMNRRYDLFRELVGSGAGKVFVAHVDDGIVESLGIFHKDDLYRFQEVMVVEPYRNRCIGSQLIVRAVKYAQSMADDPTTVICATAGGDAARLYSRLGFVTKEKGYSMTVKRPE